MRIAATIVALLLAAGAASAQVQPGPTLSAVRAKGVLDCGGHPGAPGFGSTDSQGIYRGLEADTCRAIAAAVLGDPAKVRFTVLTSQARLPALQSGQIEVLPRTTTWTQTRDTANGLNFTVVTFFDGQGFLVRTASGVNRAKALEHATICVTSGTTNELNLTDWGRTTGIRFQPVVFEQPTETVQAYEKGRCDALSTDASQLIGIRTGLQRPEDHKVLPDIISKEPLAPAVRHGDDQWFDIVKWTIYALIGAEELGVTQANVEELARSSNDPDIKRMLGKTGTLGPDAGMPQEWAVKAIKAVGNYGEIFERHIGKSSRFKMERGKNDLWTRGGLIYGLPIR